MSHFRTLISTPARAAAGPAIDTYVNWNHSGNEPEVPATRMLASRELMLIHRLITIVLRLQICP